MVSRGLLRDAVEAIAKLRHQRVQVSTVQRRIRVGFATAHHLVAALEAAGVLDPYHGDGRLVLVRDAESGHRLVAEAIEDGRIELDVPEQAVVAHRYEREDGEG